MISLTPLGSDHFPFLISPFLFSLSRPPFFPLTPLDRPRAAFRSWAEEWGPCTTKCTRNLENASLNPENARKRWNPSCPVFFLVQKDLDLEWKIENAQLKCTKKSQMYQEIGISQFSVSSKSSHTTIDHRPYDQVTAIQHDDAEHR